MKFYLISDNNDTAIGMRLAGIEGVVVHDEQSVRAALESALADESIGVVLMTSRLVKLCPDKVIELKQTSVRPLIVEIPDRHGTGGAGEAIARYVRESVGIKI